MDSEIILVIVLFINIDDTSRQLEHKQNKENQKQKLRVKKNL